MIIPSVGIVAFRNDEVLLVRHGAGAGHLTDTYGLPAGRLEPGESEIAAAQREFNEETGLTVELSDLHEFPDNYFVAVIPRKDGTEQEFGWKVFRADAYTGDFKSSEETTPVWIKSEELDKLHLLPNVALAIANAKRGSHD